MPTYSYRCQQCQAVHAVEHGMQDTLAPPCPTCGGFTERVINQAPILIRSDAPSASPEEPSPPRTVGGCSWHCNHDHH